MAHVKLYDGAGDEKARRTQDNIRRSLGALPATFQAMGRSGAFLQSMLQLEDAAGKNLDEQVRQLIALAVSAANGCSYCLLAHRALALKAGASDEEVSGALEIAAMMSAYNTFNKAIGLEHDITPEAADAVASAAG
ncbi:MAG: carboxymuconolactone decarboxylase family protein [Myxococcales bacterium]|nr:carboxymuconolactone decarboxylase family protein [Myxococcales bacterium]MCB9755167.1 carboxymuconolactone decarboxylase family protein [Myxococcales bacterium]